MPSIWPWANWAMASASKALAYVLMSVEASLTVVGS